ncbi:MAG: hypothetical protein JOZ51_04810 [Chloroflexi bacterium]|nr:hypothetical protein [Chloroflexota bacterium]
MTRRQRSDRPRALLIVTSTAHVDLRDALVEQGFAVTIARSLVAGYAQIRRLLATDQPPRPTLILLDVASYDPGFPELPGTLLAAAVAAQMRAGSLRPAWLVGISVEHHVENDSEALIAGCQRVIHLPLTSDDSQLLRRLATRPAPVPHRETQPEVIRVIEVLQAVAQRVLYVVQAAQTRIWTPEEVAVVLRWLTPYPAQSGSSRKAVPETESVTKIQQLLRALGGVRSARQRLHSIAEQWQTRYPLHGEILRLFLDGWERREIVRYFVDRGLYEDSRIYHCIKELPRRICDQLRRDQAMRHEVIGAE